jgi:hypothetical protein
MTDTPDPALSTVRGSVVHADGSAVGSLVVQAYHRRLGGERQLGSEALTDDRGRYTIGYARPDDLTTVDLFVRAFDDEQTIVAVSPIVTDAAPRETLDLIVDDPRFRGPSEFEVASAALTPAVGDADLATLDADDVALLVRTKGVGRVQVTAWIAAARLAARTDVEHESLYGLIRIEQTASLPRLLRRSSDQLVRALRRAAVDNLISAAAGRRADETAAALSTLAVERSSATDTPRSLGRLLRTCTVASRRQQAAFLRRYAGHDGPIRPLWQELRADAAFGDRVVADLQLSLQLGVLTANHEPLVRALRASGITHASEAAVLDRGAWQRLLASEVEGARVGVPPTIKGATAAARQEHYLRLLLTRGARAFPTAHVTQTLKTLPEWQSSAAVGFLDRNRDVDLLTADLRTVLRTGGVVEPGTDTAALTSELGTLQRVTRVAPRGQEAAVVAGLLGNGYTSALAISRHSRATFRGRTRAAFGDDDATADAVHRNAQFQVARTSTAYGLMHPALGGGVAAAVGGLSAAVTDDPTWASLFGGVDFCACPHCGSIFGPAAYFVDLLSWLDGHDAGRKTAFELLDGRRPDLQRVELSCANTDTVLPYTDLLTEILEARVLNPTNRSGGAQVPASTSATSPELLANPEYLDTRVYDKHLATAAFPHTLPFDLWGELGRVYFDHLGVPRVDLMETLQRRAGRALVPTGPSVDAERLRLSGPLWRIVSGTARHDVWEYWGYDSERPDGVAFTTDLAAVDTFCDHAGISYAQLLDLLHSRFVNPTGIGISGSTDDTATMRISALPAALLLRAQAFLRLWRNRGWSMLALDKALHAVAPDGLDAAALSRLADLDRVQVLTGASLLDVLSWWSPIDTYTDRPTAEVPETSLYDRVFANRAVDPSAGSPDFVLALDAAGTELAAPPEWETIRSLLEASLAVSATDLAVLLDETVDGVPNADRVVVGTTASAAGLSALYRHVSLSRSLRLGVGELADLRRLVGIDPFDAVGPSGTAGTIELAETLADIRASGFSLTDLHYLLEHDPAAETGVGVTDEAIGQTLVDLRDGLARVDTDYPDVTDPTGSATARHLAMLLHADSVATVMTLLGTVADAGNHVELETDLTNLLVGFDIDIDAVALVALPPERRFSVVAGFLATILRRTQGRAVIVEKVAGFADLELDAVQDLLASRLSMTLGGTATSALDGLRRSPYTESTVSELTPVDDPDAFAALRHVFKAAVVLRTLDIDIDAQRWLFEVGVPAGLLDPGSLPIAAQPVASGSWQEWRRLVDLAALSKDLPAGEPTLVDLLWLLEAAADDGDPTVAEDDFRAQLAIRTGWSREDLDYLIGAFTPAFPAGWRDGRVLRRLVEAFALTGRLGVSAVRADSWVTDDIGSLAAEELRLAAKAKYDDERWPAVARALRDPVREQQRAALVDFVMARDAYADELELYSDLLIDVEMAPCMLTSRLKQAISTVQLFIERAFLNLEEDVEFTRDDRDQWVWMKNYRVWEAARKVFLYPENWIEPELRLDKSALFEQLETTLMQGELDDAAAERAYTGYLEGLMQVARPEVMGMYHQYESDGDGTVDVLHLVARSRSLPHAYYYRQWIDAREWTTWDEIGTDIDGEHVILAVTDRRLLVFWPSVVQKAEPVYPDDAELPPTQNDFFELKLAWVERMDGQWAARRMSSEFLTVSGVWDESESDVYFRLGSGATVVIECLRRASYYDGSTLVGTFTVDRSSGEVHAQNASEPRTDLVPVGGGGSRMRFTSQYVSVQTDGVVYTSPVTMVGAVRDADGNIVSGPEDSVLLAPVDPSSTTLVSYAYPHQYGDFTSQGGVFLDDVDHTFHVIPSAAADLDNFGTADTVAPSDVEAVEPATDDFEPAPDDPTFEPELPWDKQQTPPLIAGQRSGLRAQGSIAADATALATSLAVPGLQQSQNQLFEVDQSYDTMAFPQTTKYRFALFGHPYVADFMTEVRRSGVTGLLDPNPDGPAPRLVRQAKTGLEFFTHDYVPTSDVLLPYPVLDIDFSLTGAYSAYNWELFFHVPLLMAGRLSANQRFEEARRWFHFMFDPTNRTDDEDPLRYWKIQPFYRTPDKPIEDFLAMAAAGDDSPESVTARASYDLQIEAWLADPFSPQDIADVRTTAYQKTLVMKYLDNLVAWGDQLFRQDTIESINEATQLYVLALQLLGDAPDALPPREPPVPTTFEQVRASLGDTVLTNPLVELENVVGPPRITAVTPYSSVLAPAVSWTGLLFPRPVVDVPQAATGFYFCIPPNDKLLSYWGTVEDRLFKIRHCMNIEGVVRQLPLFEPPIDPGMLVRARAAGIDLSSALTSLSAPLPHYRFSFMLQKAYALNQTVRGLGAALLGTLEKNDAEALSLVRADQESALLDAVRQVKTLAVDEARHTQAAAEASRTAVEQRRDYYFGLIVAGLRPEEIIQYTLMDSARKKQTSGSTAMGIGGGLSSIPTIVTGASGIAASPVATSTVVVGLALAKATELLGQALTIDAANLNAEASSAGISAGYIRRAEDWAQQYTSAMGEIEQIAEQIEAAGVRVAMAERDLADHDRQVENARVVREFMEQKFTTVDLYQWMIGQLSSVYFASYQLAYDLAKRTEQAYRHELAQPAATFIQFGYWDSLKKGLLAGDRLQQDLERLDAGYLDANEREYELTRHVSLALLDPVALLQLQTAGSCEFSIREADFDIDYAGHYLRRIRSVGVTVPCVKGPFTGLPMRLSLLSSQVRTDPSASGTYPMDPSGADLRFQQQTGAVQSVALSTGREDAGLFVADNRDERYLPFEGCGAISNWSLSLTSAVQTFAWSTITDVVLHVRYTSREGGDTLRAAALDALTGELTARPLRRAFSARSEFPTPWNAFLRPTVDTSQAILTVDLSDAMFPYFTHDAELTITNLELTILVKDTSGWRPTTATVITGSNSQQLTFTSSTAVYAGNPTASASYPSGADPGSWQVSIDIGDLGSPADWADDLVFVATYEAQLVIG